MKHPEYKNGDIVVSFGVTYEVAKVDGSDWIQVKDSARPKAARYVSSTRIRKATLLEVLGFRMK